jgi:2-oxoglutarate ferredoxin oxidoreductase subunit delta
MSPENQEGKKPKRKFRGEVFVNRERCKGCGFCVEFCPTHVLVMDNELNKKGYHPPVISNLQACTGCDLCGLYCPDFAIFGIRVQNQSAAKEQADER